MGCVRFFTDNYTDLTRLADYNYSSENTPLYPVTNGFASRRSKVWRTKGYFKIESGANTIVFNEGASNLTATITAGEYTSITTFLAAVKSALDAAGLATYTVAQNGDLRITITSDLSGGATILSILWTDANSADMAGILGFSTASDDTGASTYTADLIRIHTSEWITFDLGVPGKPNCAAITTSRNSSIPITPSATISLYGNHTNTFTSPVFSQNFEYDDEIFVLQNETEFSSTALRFWSFYFQDLDTSNGYIEIGHFMLGRHEEPAERGAVQYPFNGEFEDRSVTIISEGGATFSDQKEKTEKFSLQWSALTKTEMQGLKDIFETYGTSTAFFMSYDSDEVFSDASQRYVKLVKFDSPPRYSLTNPNFFTCSMIFKEEI